MQLTWRFVLLIAALLRAVAATTVAGLRAMQSLDDALSGVVDNDTPRLLAITHARRLFRSLGVLERDYILAKDAVERKSLDAKAGSMASELSEQLGRYERLAPAEDRQVLGQIRGARDRFVAVSTQLRQAALQDDDAALALAKPSVEVPGRRA